MVWMPELDDQQLLREFAGSNSEAAFATLVARYVNLVYSTALRFSGNPHRAEEITQAVFIILARKAGGWRRGAILSGWLYQTARLTAANLVKGEMRRQRREQEAGMQSMLNEPEEAAWEQIAPLLDDAMGRLGETDRNVVVLRFFENKTAREVAAALKLTEAAAHKRVNRALEKLRKFFARRGITSTTAVIGGAISANSVQAAPVALAKSVTVVALAKGAAASASTLTLIKGALKIMAWTKAKTAVVVGLGVLLAAGTTTVTVREIQQNENDDSQWDTGQIDSRILNTGPHIVKIIPTKFHRDGWASTGDGSERRIYGVGHTAKELVQAVYGSGSSRTIFLTTLPEGRFDYIANLTSSSGEAMKRLIKRKFGVAGNFQMLETNILLLKVEHSNATGLEPSTSENSSTQIGSGEISMTGVNIDRLAWDLEANVFRIPVIDETGLTNRYDFKIQWDDLDGLKQALVDQLGLELVPTNMPIEMLVVERAP